MHKFMSLTGLLLFTLSVSAFAATSAKTFIPKGWHEIANAAGDLNGDGQPDIAMALASDQEETATMDSAEVPRLLVILFKTSDGYTLATKTDQVLLCKTCGGVFGDPFESINVSHGTLVIVHYGGSRERWRFTYRFRYQNGDFFLIGKTIENSDIMNPLTGDSTDTNLITGDRIKTVTTRGGKSTTSSTRVARKPLVSISSPNIAKILSE